MVTRMVSECCSCEGEGEVVGAVQVLLSVIGCVALQGCGRFGSPLFGFVVATRE